MFHRLWDRVVLDLGIIFWHVCSISASLFRVSISHRFVLDSWWIFEPSGPHHVWFSFTNNTWSQNAMSRSDWLWDWFVINCGFIFVSTLVHVSIPFSVSMLESVLAPFGNDLTPTGSKEAPQISQVRHKAPKSIGHAHLLRVLKQPPPPSAPRSFYPIWHRFEAPCLLILATPCELNFAIPRIPRRKTQGQART